MEELINRAPSSLFSPATLTKKAPKYQTYNPIIHKTLDYSNSSNSYSFVAPTPDKMYIDSKWTGNHRSTPISRAAQLSIGNTLKYSPSVNLFSKTRFRDAINDPITGTVKKVQVVRPPIKCLDKDLFEINGAYRKSGICNDSSPFRSQTKLRRKF